MAAIAAVESTTGPAVCNWVPSHVHRLSVDEYQAMVASGVFGKKDRLHLVNGFLVEKMTQNPHPRTADDLCGQALALVLPPGWYVRSSQPVRLPPGGMPEPDRCVVRGSVRDYVARDPGPSDVGLVVEIADSGLDEDRRQAAIYAAAGVPVYGIVNLVDRQIGEYTSPTANGYATQEKYVPGRAVRVSLDGMTVGMISVDLILP